MSAGRQPSLTAPPSCAGSLLLGSARALQRDQLGTYQRAMAEHGAMARFRIGPPRVGFVFDTVFDPDGAHQVLATDAAHYGKDAPIYTEIARVVGDGLLTSEGERWKRQRRILQPLFTRQRVAAAVDTIAAETAELVRRCAADADAARPLDLHALSTRHALNVLARTIFGGDLDAGWQTLQETLPLLSEHATRRGLSPLRLPASWPTPANRRAERARAALFGFVDGLVAERRRSEATDDLLGRLVRARDPETGAGLDDRAIRDQAVTFLLAGHETTGATLAFALHLLGRDDAVQQRVRAEVAGVLGDRLPAAADVEQLPVTTAVVDEAMRLYPPAHTLVRRATGDTALLGHRVPTGRIMAVSVWGIHRSPAVWADPGAFDPERFVADAPAQRERYAHLPFGGGPRTCIGVHLALAELVVAVAMVVRAYRLDALVDTPTLDAGITLRPGGPIPSRFTPVADTP